MSSAARGKKFNKTKRGGPRTFTVQEWDKPDELRKKGGSDSDEDSSDEDTPAPKAAPSKPAQQKKAIGRSDDTSEEEEDTRPDVLPKPKEYGKPLPEPAPVEEFETLNVNRVAPKMMKASDLSKNDNVPMSRREREQADKERAKAAFWKAQMEGKTDQARADLARLAIIRKQREEAARKKAEEAGKSGASGSKAESLSAGKGIISKTLGANK